MVVTLNQVVPFGRSQAEYQLMFNLTRADLNKAIIGVGDGPASFNAEMTAQGYSVLSVDPIYELSADQIQQRFDECVEGIIQQVRNTPNDWIWTYHRSPDHLKENRIKAICRFTWDYPTGKEDGRYAVGSLPKLAFADDSFDLALCSHFLFLYSDHLDFRFHLESIREMCRIATEVRIFPLLTLDLNRSPYIDSIQETLEREGIASQIVKVGYQLQKGAEEMICFSRLRSRPTI